MRGANVQIYKWNVDTTGAISYGVAKLLRELQGLYFG